YFSRAAVAAAKDRMMKYFETHAEITAATFRDLLGASRKFAIALLDHFDHTGVTTRVGDTRRLRNSF
ncbi:MAG TPA: SelB C-terminal domain-containing protein, partial [Candidatus Acidoferrum sp.]|nr:SelB C-terminal domain-containing protein [Candidatus Acidoferrum sp.]